jgi:protein-tyrosine-phosphatase
MAFIDDDNSCASQMAEAIGNALEQPQFVFSSAGLRPGTVDPGLIEFLRGKGIDISRAVPRSIEQAPNLDFAHILVALSPDARRAFSTSRKAIWLDWSGLPDPRRSELPPERRQSAYEDAWKFLHQHISDLCEAVLADNID